MGRPYTSYTFERAEDALRLQLINPGTSPKLNTTLTPHSITHGEVCFAYFNKIWDIPGGYAG
jgi:hypothetical protein